MDGREGNLTPLGKECRVVKKVEAFGSNLAWSRDELVRGLKESGSKMRVLGLEMKVEGSMETEDDFVGSNVSADVPSKWTIG